MPYNISRTHKINNESTPATMNFTDITVNDNSVERSFTSSAFVGTNFLDYSASIFESLVWRMSNYAYHSEPNNAINGQLWYDTSVDTLKVLVGEDYSSEWYDLKSPSTLGIDGNIIPDTNNKYLVGNNVLTWKALYTENLYVKSDLSFLLGDSSQFTDIDTLIPREAIDIKNNSIVAGDNVADALINLTRRVSATEITIIDVTQEGGTYNISPADNVRYRFTSDTPITLNIQYTSDPSISYFEVFGAGLGNITLTGDTNVSFRINANVFGEDTFRVALFSIEDFSDAVGSEINSWNSIGDYN
jgi:hypothetical protein